MKKGRFISSFNYAVQGIISVLKTERNMKFHYLAALGIIILSLFFDISSTEFLLMLFSITLVVFAEMINTAILFKIKNMPNHLAFVSLLIIIIATVGAKFLMAKKSGGTYFQGGGLSGHSAVSFCAATIITMIAENSLVTLCSFGLAFLVAESRVEGKIHKVSEVVVGAILGVCVAIFVFKVVG